MPDIGLLQGPPRKPQLFLVEKPAVSPPEAVVPALSATEPESVPESAPVAMPAPMPVPESLPVAMPTPMAAPTTAATSHDVA